MKNEIRIYFEKDGPAIIGDIAICRCGLSRNKPYCDGRHIKYLNDLPEQTITVEVNNERR